ncbi:MAG: hypothetical protein AAF639_32745 [Chloroflexota bacterium]
MMFPLLMRGRILSIVGNIFVLLMLLSVLVGCTPDANTLIMSPSLGAQLTAIEDGRVPEVVLPPAPPTLLEYAGENDIYAGLPDGFEDLVVAADPADGVNLATANACIGCHAVDPAVEMTGPSWYDLGNRSVVRAEETGLSPANYLYTSIVDPNSYLVEGYNEGIMVQTYGETISEGDLATLVAYILDQQAPVESE